MSGYTVVDARWKMYNEDYLYFGGINDGTPVKRAYKEVRYRHQE